jgi:hypothetical protein
VVGRGFAVEIRHTINKAGIALIIDMRKDLSHDNSQSGRLPTLIGDLNYKSVDAVACNPYAICGPVCEDDGRRRQGCCFPWPITNVAAMSSDLVGLAGPGLACLARSRSVRQLWYRNESACTGAPFLQHCRQRLGQANGADL